MLLDLAGGEVPVVSVEAEPVAAVALEFSVVVEAGVVAANFVSNSRNSVLNMGTHALGPVWSYTWR